jgi:glycerol-3-phosphate dehydrogenase
MQPLERDHVWAGIQQHPWDLIIVGGGITGAGIFRYAAAAGLSVLLLEERDYASGTSSKSSKLVHGGLRYLNQGQFNVTYESVRERERLLHEVPELVEPMCFLINNYVGAEISTKKYMLGLVIYDLMGDKWNHGRVKRGKLLSICPQLNPDGLKNGLFYFDAVVDDARLVMRLIEEGEGLGGTAINYASVVELMRTSSGEVTGVVVERKDNPDGRSIEIPGRAVINATGPWTDTLRGLVGRKPIIRKQRGSHLVIDGSKLPLTHAITFDHPKDHRTMFFIPWNDTTVVGTTDLDHPIEYEQKAAEPFVDKKEFDYLMEAVHVTFPHAGITKNDVLSTFSGLRPIIRMDSISPSAQSRRHAVYEDHGLLTITGGKLTTYRVMAKAVLARAIPRLSKDPHFQWNEPMFDKEFIKSPTEIVCPERLVDRYGIPFLQWLKNNQAISFESLPGCTITPLEITYAAAQESVVHLDDLLLRRVRLGLIQHGGGIQHLEYLKESIMQVLGWSSEKWQDEVKRYKEIIQDSYSLPEV